MNVSTRRSTPHHCKCSKDETDGKRQKERKKLKTTTMPGTVRRCCWCPVSWLLGRWHTQRVRHAALPSRQDGLQRPPRPNLFLEACHVVSGRLPSAPGLNPKGRTPHFCNMREELIRERGCEQGETMKSIKGHGNKLRSGIRIWKVLFSSTVVIFLYLHSSRPA